MGHHHHAGVRKRENVSWAMDEKMKLHELNKVCFLQNLNNDKFAIVILIDANAVTNFKLGEKSAPVKRQLCITSGYRLLTKITDRLRTVSMTEFCVEFVADVIPIWVHASVLLKTRRVEELVHVKSVYAQCSSVTMVWKLEEEIPAHVLSSPLVHDLKL
ncbi:hypothetical protein TNCV_1061411 [Trichonephila clavipes]|nr:hypothetical protein TNCV_1061411 [Trichonephila clavipes]